MVSAHTGITELPTYSVGLWVRVATWTNIFLKRNSKEINQEPTKHMRSGSLTGQSAK